MSHPPTGVEAAADVEREVQRTAAVVLAAASVLERCPSRDGVRAARLRWAVDAGRAELQRLAGDQPTERVQEALPGPGR